MRTQWLTLAGIGCRQIDADYPRRAFSLHTVTKQTFWINIIIAVQSPLRVSTSRGFLSTKNFSCTPCMPIVCIVLERYEKRNTGVGQ